MKHVTAIETLIDDGEFSEAEQALDNLLALGPNNVEALKLLASLQAHKGKFADEEKTWQRLWSIDREDEDVVEYFYQAQIEDKEHFYFTDLLPTGGRRFIAYPRSLINASLFGLLGCIVFLIASHQNFKETILGQDYVTLTLFSLLVIMPWIWIIATWTRALKAVEIDAHSFCIVTRLRTYKIDWKDIKDIYLAHSNQNHGHGSGLRLIFIAKDHQTPVLSIDLSESRSSIRARKFLINEIGEFHDPIKYESMNNISLKHRTVLDF